MAPKERMAMRLKRLRIDRGLSQTALAKKAGLSRGYLVRLEAAQQDPTLTVIEKLAKALKVRPAELLQERPRAMDRDELIEQLTDARKALQQGKNVLAMELLAQEMEKLGPDYGFHAKILRAKGDNERVIHEITSILGKLTHP